MNSTFEEISSRYTVTLLMQSQLAHTDSPIFRYAADLYVIVADHYMVYYRSVAETLTYLYCTPRTYRHPYLQDVAGCDIDSCPISRRLLTVTWSCQLSFCLTVATDILLYCRGGPPDTYRHSDFLYVADLCCVVAGCHIVYFHSVAWILSH